MREVQGFPEDYDGALTGARMSAFNSIFMRICSTLFRLSCTMALQTVRGNHTTISIFESNADIFDFRNGFNIYVGQLNMNDSTPGEVVPTSFFATWAQEVLAQCDEIDGVKDNIILNVSEPLESTKSS